MYGDEQPVYEDVEEAEILVEHINSSSADDQSISRVLDRSEEMFQEDESHGDLDDDLPESRPKARRPTVNTKAKWTTEEEEEIKIRFRSFFKAKQGPPPSFCAKVIEKSPILKKRKKDVLKKKVFRMVDALSKV